MKRGVEGLPDEERLQRPGPVSLEKRYWKGDMIKVCRIPNGEEKAARDLLLTVSQQTRTRGQGVKRAASSLN